MRKILLSLLFIVLPISMFAVGIPIENRKMIFTVTLVGVIIVLLALFIVMISVAIMSKIIYSYNNRSSQIVKKIKKETMSNNDDDVAVAIALALHLEKQLLDEEEKAILTIRKVIKPFSGWNNKAFSMRNPR